MARVRLWFGRRKPGGDMAPSGGVGREKPGIPAVSACGQNDRPGKGDERWAIRSSEAGLVKPALGSVARMRKRALAMMGAAALGFSGPAVGTAQDNPGAGAEQRKIRDVKITPVATQHRLALADRVIDYRAVVESLPFIDATGATTAEVAVISYVSEASSSERRPVTFVFNGGPGASSAFLQLGGLGPRVLMTGPAGTVPAPPARLEDNPDSWLAFTDLVFIDPVGTGFSRAASADSDAERAFWSVSSDTGTLAEVIRLWLTRNERWPSPKFIAGESYGAFRGVKITRRLLDDQGVALNGLVMISPALDIALISASGSDVLPWALALPSLVASARAHGKGNAATSLEEVERFALTDYLVGIAAMAPDGPGPAPALIGAVAGLLGLGEDLVRRHHGRVPPSVFAEHLLEGTGRSLSLYDGALAGPDPRTGHSGPDPQLDAIKAPLSSAYNTYIRDELKLKTDVPFRLLNAQASRRWDWEGARRRSGGGDSAMDDLAEAIALTPGLDVLVVNGRTDMVTPYMTSRWLLDRLDLPPESRAGIRLELLEGGHMMYLRPDRRAALHRVAAEFYRQ